MDVNHLNIIEPKLLFIIIRLKNKMSFKKIKTNDLTLFPIITSTKHISFQHIVIKFSSMVQLLTKHICK